MDWKYKHFNQEAVFKAPRQSVLYSAIAIMAESFGGIENTADGFVASGQSAWHAATATFHVTAVQDGTQVAVELLVERAAMRGYMLFDIGGYYDGQIDKWFTGILQRLGVEQQPALVRTTTSNLKVQQGCLSGCIVYLVVGACLGIFAIPLDRALFSRSSGSGPGPFGTLASAIGLIAGVAVLLYRLYPDAPASKFISERLHRNRKS